ncbi:MAG: glycyl-radical enzyme activating protein [Thermoplasmata archaeon]
MKGLIFNIQGYCIHDGPGIRTTVFFKGCPLRCIWCQNPEGQLFRPEVFLNKSKCTGCGRCILVCQNHAVTIKEGKSNTNRDLCKGCGKCAEVCPNGARSIVGKWLTVEEIFEKVKKDKIFYDSSGGGVTLSGGEPLLQHEFAYNLLKLCKSSGINTAIETSGYVEWPILKKILEYCDLILYDFKHMDPVLHKKHTGVSNELILENAKRICSELSIPMWARVPIIPGYNDSFENLEKIAKFIAELPKGSVIQVNLLPYHKLGEGKLDLLERPLLSINTPSQERITEIKKIFESHGLKTLIGG